MLAHVPQEGQHVQAGGPVEIVHDFGRCGARVEIDEPRDLLLDFFDPAGDDVSRVELALLGFEAGVADQAGRPAHQRQRLVARQLKAAQHQQGHQGTDMQAVGSGVETAIEGATPAVQPARKFILAGNLENQPASAELVQ